MTYMDVLQQVKKKQLESVYLLYGTESYFIQKITTAIKTAVLSNDANSDEHFTIYDLEETPVQDVIADAETYPLFGGMKLIIATNPSFLKTKPDKLPFEHDLDRLTWYLQEPVDYSIIIFTAPYEKIDERKKVAKLLKQNGTTAECNPIKEYDLRSWISNFASSMGLSIQDDVYELLESELTADLHLLRNELYKLKLYVGENGTVTREIAEKLVAYTGNSTSLRLVDAVIDRDLHRAILIYKDLEKINEEPVGLVALLAFQFRAILRVKLLNRKGYSQSQMQKQLGTHPYVIKMALQREKKFTATRLQDIMDKLAETDHAMKDGSMEKELAFELLLYHLVQ
ncbi:DNA polymerase III subunit delta [Lentibacillus halophilus]|uniref:DNA polymerase III subunit delta n=1 Tax=Lentibacillus halophilus TaxID=295065 RepID=A0ABP3J5Z5_9BACI